MLSQQLSSLFIGIFNGLDHALQSSVVSLLKLVQAMYNLLHP
jgi:hypothetical protein